MLFKLLIYIVLALESKCAIYKYRPLYIIDLSVFELIMNSVNGKEGVAGPDRFGSEISLCLQ